MFTITLHYVRHRQFVSDLARGITLYVASIGLSDDSTDTLHLLKNGESVRLLPRRFLRAVKILLFTQIHYLFFMYVCMYVDLYRATLRA